MNWQQVQERFPSRWLLVEAIEAHSIHGSRVLDDLSVVQEYSSGRDALIGYLEHHRRAPHRELYVLHTDRVELAVEEGERIGLRPLAVRAVSPATVGEEVASWLRRRAEEEKRSVSALVRETLVEQYEEEERFWAKQGEERLQSFDRRRAVPHGDAWM